MVDPRTPEALLASIRNAIAAVREAEPACSTGTHQEIERAERAMSARLDVVNSLEKLIPDPPRLSADVISLAEVARLAEGSLCSALKLLPKAVLHMERDLAERTLTSQGAAAEIVALINNSPRSPRQDEIEAILAKIAATARGAAAKSERWLEWHAVVGETNGAYARCSALEDAAGDGYPETVVAAEAEITGAMNREDDCARRIWQQPVRSWDDVTLLAAICYRTLWSGGDLTAADADARMAEGPDHDVSEICADALAALLKGIRDLSTGGANV